MFPLIRKRILSILFAAFCAITPLWVNQASAQESSVDSTELYPTDSMQLRYRMKLFKTVDELADSVFPALQSRKFDKLLPFLPSAAVLQDQFDTMDKEYLQRLAKIKAEYIASNLRKQHRKMLKEAKGMGCNLRAMERTDLRIRYSEHLDVEIADVTYYCRYNKRRFYISFLAMRVMGHWFLADQLRIRGT